MAKKVYTRKLLVETAALARKSGIMVGIYLNERGKWAVVLPLQHLCREVGTARETYEYLIGLYHGATLK